MCQQGESLKHLAGLDFVKRRNPANRNCVRLQTQERDFCIGVNKSMNTRELQRNAEHCLNRASETPDTMQRIRFIRAAKAWRSLAAAKSQLDATLFMDE